MLVIAVLGTLELIFTACVFVFIKAAPNLASMDAELAQLAEPIMSILLFSFVIKMLMVVVHYLIYFSLKSFKKLGLTMVIAQNVLVPLVQLACIPMIIKFFDKVIENLTSVELSAADMSEIMSMQPIFVSGIMVALVMTAVISGGVLAFNSVYFYKRKDLLN